MNSKVNISSDAQVKAERQWKAIDALIEAERTHLTDLARIWNRPLTELMRWKEEKKLLPTALEHNLILRYDVSSLWLWMGEEPILLDPPTTESHD